ncbi:hypothetical protein COZ40_02755 [Candidatus Roizmanbacteria bacterium CG_4_10_14_3_um_filter_39_13]|uniref:FAD dependent oxidoreductase domain-containing protein n=1 Tax=Candidatus Roizmanbacteria bacterium CG_4_10_14_3_um_filter_39_13 TaxID=1974831 RepID=A0A2M7LKC5_9BACT|nr:MAG: hypothetical protein COZ40_02755 [Candidatus Roizmanbacteria bacterium CG_4_10_14_3_um_filter_39_13]
MALRENVFRPEVRDIEKPADLVVIGGGMVGPSIAHFAQEKLGSKSRVVVLEANQGLAMGASSASLEQGRIGWPDETVCRMMMMSREFFQRPQDFGINMSSSQLGFTERPYLWAASKGSEIKTYQNLTRVLKSRGVDASYLDRQAIIAEYPWLKDTSVTGGMLDTSGFKIDSQQLARAFAQASGRTDFFVQTKGLKIVVSSGKVIGVNTSRGFIPTERVIVAAGAGTRGLIETVDGLSIPIVSIPRFSVSSRGRDPSLSISNPFIIVPKTYAYWRPDGAGILGGYSHEIPPIDRPENTLPDIDPSYRKNFLTAVWKGLNPDRLDNPEDAKYDTLGLLASVYSYSGPYSKGSTLGGFYVHRAEALGDDRPIITTFKDQGMPDIGVVTAEQGHGVMGALPSGVDGAEIIIGGSSDPKYDNFSINPPASQGISLTI